MARPHAKYSWIYAMFKPLVWATANGFYRKRIVTGKEHIPPAGTPVIIVSNHQNGMMDPVMLCLVHPKQLHFLTRSDVFKKPLAAKFFGAINMMPIYRDRDNLPDMAERNEAIFNECSDRLAGGCTIALFPEGTHGNMKHLRPAKKGAARLAFGAAARHPQLDNLVVLPVGMDYSDFIDYRSVLRVTYSPPLRLSGYMDAYAANQNKAVTELTRDFENALRQTMVHYHPAELYPAGRVAFQLAHTSGLARDEVAFSRIFSEKMAGLPNAERMAMEEELKACKASAKSMGLDERAFSPKGNEWIVFVILLNFWIYRQIVRWVPYKWVERFTARKVRDPHFISSARLVLTMFALPVWWLVLGTVASLVFGNAWLLLWVPVCAGLVTVPGLMADDSLQMMRQRMRWRKWRNTPEGQHLQAQRQSLTERLRSFLA